MRNTIRNFMLGTALVAALAGAGVATAQEWRGDHDREWRRAQRPLIHQEYRLDGYGQNYIPPCPGEGYVWTAGYYDGGYWVPGSWILRRGWQPERGFYRGYGYDPYTYNGGERRRDERAFGRDDREFRHDEKRDFRHDGGYRDRR